MYELRVAGVARQRGAFSVYATQHGDTIVDNVGCDTHSPHRGRTTSDSYICRAGNVDRVYVSWFAGGICQGDFYLYGVFVLVSICRWKLLSNFRHPPEVAASYPPPDNGHAWQASAPATLL